MGLHPSGAIPIEVSWMLVWSSSSLVDLGIGEETWISLHPCTRWHLMHLKEKGKYQEEERSFNWTLHNHLSLIIYPFIEENLSTLIHRPYLLTINSF